MTGKKVAYKRVSTVDQNPERQLEGIFFDKEFVDYASGSTLNRPQLDLLRDYVREDDLVLVHSMDRLARNVKDLRNLLDEFIYKKVSVQFVKENLIFTAEKSPMADLLLMLIGAIAEFELSLIRERQREGVALAKKAGKYKGRKRVLNNEKKEIINAELLTRKSKSKIAEDLGISRFTLYRYINGKYK